MFSLIAIAQDRKMMKNAYYVLIIQMGIADIVQLLFNGVASGILTLTGCDDCFWVKKLIGGLMNACWVVYCFLAHLLAFNRFVHLVLNHQVKLIFSNRNTKIFLAVIWLYGFGWFIAYMTPVVSVLYNTRSYAWHYDTTATSKYAWIAELIVDSFHAICMLVWYTIIFIYLKIKVCKNDVICYRCVLFQISSFVLA